jgi:hypothetical protein
LQAFLYQFSTCKVADTNSQAHKLSDTDSQACEPFDTNSQVHKLSDTCLMSFDLVFASQVDMRLQRVDHQCRMQNCHTTDHQ